MVSKFKNRSKRRLYDAVGGAGGALSHAVEPGKNMAPGCNAEASEVGDGRPIDREIPYDDPALIFASVTCYVHRCRLSTPR